jgi:hypothetical protein
MLTEPDMKKLKHQVSQNENTEVILNYLSNNYKKISEKFDIEYNESRLCAFKQDFENQIKYAVSECKEAGGSLIKLELPKSERTTLMKWVEKIYEVDKVETEEDEENVWKENNSKFEPKTAVPGCYYKIEESKNKTIIHLYCGC